MNPRITGSFSPNTVSVHLVNTSRAPRNRGHTTEVKKQLKDLKSRAEYCTPYSQSFSTEKITVALKDVKPRKAPGSDGIYSEFLLYCGGFYKIMACIVLLQGDRN